MSTAPAAPAHVQVDDAPDGLVREALALEARGDFPGAVQAWTRASERWPGSLPVRLGLAQARLRAGDADAAIPLLESVIAHAPSGPAAWLALAVARSMLDRHDDAIDAAERAVALAPRLAEPRLGLGDVLRRAGRAEDAQAAYARAVELAPGNVDALNKLATMLRAGGDASGAEALLRRALEIAPGHPYLRVNAATLALALRRHDEGRRELESVLADRRLPPDARHEAREALAMLDEAEALGEPIDRALSSLSPAPIEAALRARPRGTAPDDELLAFLDRVADRCASGAAMGVDAARGAPASPDWSAIEAHHHYRRSRTPEAIAATVALVKRPDTARTRVELNIVQYARAVEAAGALRLDDADPVAFEANLRWIHAMLTKHRPDRAPGTFKVGTYLGLGMRSLSPCHPGETQATLDRIVTDILPRVPAGAARGAFVQVAVVTLQPFDDCNTRVGRFLQNRVLARAGIFPSLRPAQGDRELLLAVQSTGDLAPMLSSVVEGTHEASARDREWTGHDAR